MKELTDISIHAFIQKHSIRTETGEVLDFSKYRFMYDIYADRSAQIVCMKAAQIGFSTYEILKSAFECRNDKIDIIYVLPSDDDVKRFSGGKTNKIILQNPIFQTWTKDKDSIEQKQFGSNTIYYEGAWTERAALSTTAKKLVVDEYDRCKQSIVEQYDSRLQSTENPRKAFFSNPSLAGQGVHKFYMISDQRKWHIHHSCGETFVMDEDCINYDKEIYECPACKEEITDEERRMGSWIATNTEPGIKWRGYWIPLWIAPWMSAESICDLKKNKSSEYFSNFVAGEPYALSENKISSETVLQNVMDKTNLQDGTVIIGVDTGLPTYYTLMNKQGVFHYGHLKDPKLGIDPYLELEGFLRRWPKSIIISDQGGDLSPMRIIAGKFPGRVFLCYYRKNRKSKEMIQWGDGDEYGTVIVDRNRVLQMLVEELRDKGRVHINGTVDEWKPWAAHWDNIYRSKKENPFGDEYTWERNGPDHYVHSYLYGRVGLDKYGQSMATVVGMDAFADIPVGRIFPE